MSSKATEAHNCKIIEKNLKKTKKRKQFSKECAIIVQSFLYTCIQ